MLCVLLKMKSKKLSSRCQFCSPFIIIKEKVSNTEINYYVELEILYLKTLTLIYLRRIGISYYIFVILIHIMAKVLHG